VRLLLDTHIWRWSLSAPEKHGRRLRATLARPGTELWLSPIAVWELLVLAERGRIKLTPGPREWIATALNRTPADRPREGDRRAQLQSLTARAAPRSFRRPPWT
jgi:PIN domain nuclease of toxin-antitoxin system